MMRCHISLPDNCQLLEIEVDVKATGQQCLDKVCERLGILVEDDYLGLRYLGNKNEQLWLNLRNRVDQQMSGHQPFRFQLRLKFCIQPHTIQQDITRHLYFMQVWHDLKTGQLDLKGHEDKIPKLVALAAQAEFGDQTSNSYQIEIYANLLGFMKESLSVTDAIDAITQEHHRLLNVAKQQAEYRLIQVAFELPTFGFEFHEVRSARGEKIMFGVGPEGLLLKNTTNNTEESLSYPSIQMATHREREIYLQQTDDAGELLPAVGYKLVSRKAAVALYRCITEMHSFYRCDTVSFDVSNQFCRDLKGTFVSIFNENSDLGKRFVFDIKRTSREAYDYARRKLYTMSQSTQSLAASQFSSSVQSMDVDRDNNALDCASLQCQQMKERLVSWEDQFLCCICMSRFVGTVLCPCGHLTCTVCAGQISDCPLCRTVVESRQKVFLPCLKDNNEVDRQVTVCERSSEVV